VVTANRRFAELLGAGRMEEVIASHKMVFEYLGDGERIRAKKDSDMLLDGSCTVTNQEYTVNRFDGSTIPVEIGMSLLRDEHGEPRAYIGIVRNITERKEAERRHAEAMKMAERSSRLASVGTLAAGISHEINQPLTALKVKVDSMLYWKEMNVAIPQEDFDQDLRFISQQTERIDDIIKHMRALARQEKGQDPVDISLNGVIGDVIPLLRQRISAHGIQLVQNLDPALPPVRGHKTLLQQVVINLMVNAVNALDESKKNEKKITVSTRHNHSQCFLEIVDNGIGISEEYLNQIFDPFFTTRIGGEGMGLGLSICHNIVTGLGGTVTVENTRDGGARFLVSIPISRAGEEGQ
jgi:PAS domain S-box-containing protein